MWLTLGFHCWLGYRQWCNKRVTRRESEPGRHVHLIEICRNNDEEWKSVFVLYTQCIHICICTTQIHIKWYYKPYNLFVLVRSMKNPANVKFLVLHHAHGFRGRSARTYNKKHLELLYLNFWLPILTTSNIYRPVFCCRHLCSPRIDPWLDQCRKVTLHIGYLSGLSLGTLVVCDFHNKGFSYFGITITLLFINLIFILFIS